MIIKNISKIYNNVSDYTVTFDANGGDKMNPEFITVTPGEKLGELLDATREGYVFDGWYTEAKAMKDMNLAGWQDKYTEVQKKLRNVILKDPTDLNAMMLRVRCLIDMQQYEEAEEKCGYLKKELQESLLEEINKARNGGT